MDTSMGLSSIASLSLGLSMSMTGAGAGSIMMRSLAARPTTQGRASHLAPPHGAAAAAGHSLQQRSPGRPCGLPCDERPSGSRPRTAAGQEDLLGASREKNSYRPVQLDPACEGDEDALSTNFLTVHSDRKIDDRSSRSSSRSGSVDDNPRRSTSSLPSGEQTLSSAFGLLTGCAAFGQKTAVVDPNKSKTRVRKWDSDQRLNCGSLSETTRCIRSKSSLSSCVESFRRMSQHHHHHSVGQLRKKLGNPKTRRQLTPDISSLTHDAGHRTDQNDTDKIAAVGENNGPTSSSGFIELGATNTGSSISTGEVVTERNHRLDLTSDIIVGTRYSRLGEEQCSTTGLLKLSSAQTKPNDVRLCKQSANPRVSAHTKLIKSEGKCGGQAGSGGSAGTAYRSGCGNLVCVGQEEGSRWVENGSAPALILEEKPRNTPVYFIKEWNQDQRVDITLHSVA